MTRILCFLAVAAGLGGSSAQAANQYYMSGDAFFSAVLTEDVLERIAKEDHPVGSKNSAELQITFGIGVAFTQNVPFQPLEFT